MGSDLDAAGDGGPADAGPRSALRRRHARGARDVLRGPRPGEAGAGAAKGSGAARRGDARRAVRRSASRCGPARSTAGCSTRATSSSTSAGRTSGPRPPRAGARRCRSRRSTRASAACTRPRSSQLQGAWERGRGGGAGGVRRHGAHRRVRGRRRLVRGRRDPARRAATSTAPRTAYRQAHELGAIRSRARAAAPGAGPGRRRRRASIATALAAFGGSRLERAPLHAAQVEIALARGRPRRRPRRPPTR